ncbi:cytochrome p450 domain-containing protein [Phthorimaea operculella]|nr:cytochrome p450 domain-containing protein [Phthorimaea operculella]
MLLALLGLTTTVLLFLLYLKWRRTSSYWAKLNVPHTPPHFILGSLTYLQKKNAGQWMKEQYTKFKKAPYIGIWLFWRPALIVNTPEIAKRILVKDSDNFRDRLVSSGANDPIGALNIFTVNDPLWSLVRRKLTLAFTSAKLKSFQPLAVAKSKELCQRLQQEMDKKRAIDMRDIFTDYSTDIVGIAAFGVECNATLTGDCHMRRITRAFQTYSLYRGLAHTCIFFFPELVDIFRFKYFPKDAEEYFKKLFSSIVDQRGGFNKPVEDTKDFVDALIKLKQEAKDDKEVSMDLLIAQGAIFVNAGFESAATALTFLFYELAYNPECQEKLYDEVSKLKEKIGSEEFDADTLAEAVYLNACLKEVLRKFPPMGWLDRIASRDYVIDENLTIRAGTPVYINGIAMQMDPDYFPEPEKFIPERFLPENEKDIIPFTYFPFGEGPRICVGKRFSYLTLRQAIAAITLHFKIRPHPNMPEPNNLEMEKNSLFFLPGQRVSVEFIPRN